MSERRRYTDEDLASALRESRSMSEVLLRIGLVPRGGNYETVRRHIVLAGLDAGNLRKAVRGRPLTACSDAEIRDAVAVSRSFAEVLRTLGVRPGGNQQRLRKRVAQLRIDVSHFAGQAWRKGNRTPSVEAAPIDELLVEGRLVRTATLRRRLILEGLKGEACEMCGRTAWNGAPIPLELDHVNGVRDDNRLSNLRILCPNCHAQTPTYRGRNIGRSQL
jgi:HNH endonuclease